MKKLMLAAAATMCLGLFVLTGDEPVADVFTAAQAEIGRVAAMDTCAKCHTPTLRGRVGNPDENPPISSLPNEFQKFILQRAGRVPPLLGPVFPESGVKSAGLQV